MFAGVSIWQLLILLLVVVVIFGTKKLRTIGSDLGGAVRDFKKAMSENDQENNASSVNNDAKFNKIEENAQPSAQTTEKAKDKEQA
ncbi:preprotein translocase subunit SecA [Actinobacillus delphinicola]|uniref:Sec-independent protein translocase protein TatA n=1 Tax=Actinobacillus delphinicola TaxID=51161 RepID=A0A448TS81_9PAST|nr:Sec-independent protein translocase subunit TatA [Actinobacillus delphinicola]MDG6897072.1 preprotein translocase subunit SecA [Actinobacillus delphinicola]VEJ08887.1 twin arginine translocase protein A [Actinobacillus delphinicola]